MTAQAVYPAQQRRRHTIGKYLGATLVISEREVDVFTFDGTHLGTAFTMSGARRIVRAARRSKR